MPIRMSPMLLPCLLVCGMQPMMAQSSGIEHVLTDHNLAGISVVTRCGDAISIDHHEGFRNIALKLQVNEETTYRVASISKAVLALAAAKLVEQGTIGYDDPIGSYLEDPPFHPAHPDVEITLRHLLTHTSGIRDGQGYGDFLSDTYADIPDVPMLSSVLGEGGPHYTTDMWGSPSPGTWFQYANLNYGVAATVLEAATGMRFDLLMTDLLFSPYGLDAGFKVQDLEEVGDLAVLYRQVNGAWTPQADNLGGIMPTGPDWSAYAPGTNAVGFAPQGGLRISARDLSVLARLWSHGTAAGPDGQPLTFISATTLADLLSTQWSHTGNNGNNYYGLFNQWSNGLHLASSGIGDDEVIPDFEATPMPGHPGEAYGLISDAYATPDGQWNCVFVTNGKWDGYTTGPASAFYAVEQDVFAALRDDALACLASSAPPVIVDPPAVLGTPRSGDTLVHFRFGAGWSGRLRFRLLDTAGKVLSEGEAEGPDGSGRAALPTPALSPGIHIGEVSVVGGARASRFVFLVPG